MICPTVPISVSHSSFTLSSIYPTIEIEIRNACGPAGVFFLLAGRRVLEDSIISEKY
jgi:hypothetical protein